MSVSKNDEFCIKNKELCIKNKELCGQNKELCIKMMNFAGHIAMDMEDGTIITTILTTILTTKHSTPPCMIPG